MRTLVTMAAAALVGIHCSAPSDESDPTTASEEPAATKEPAPPPAPAPKAKGTEPSADEESAPSDGDRRWGTEVEGLPPALFTTSVSGDDGAIYAAGTFAGALVVGGQRLRSRGADDVVLVKLDARGRVTWAKSIGSTREERAPKVTFADGTVRILAETRGEVDCGSGGMRTWSSSMFFYCVYAADGTAIGGDSFPTGAP
jgi:hypothetical protein